MWEEATIYVSVKPKKEYGGLFHFNCKGFGWIP
jgi:hypothetical protein